MVLADSQLKLLPASTLDIYKEFEHIDMLSMAYGSTSNSYTQLTWVIILVLGHLWSQNDVITSWLRLTAN
jgi:hypothetical protein